MSHFTFFFSYTQTPTLSGTILSHCHYTSPTFAVLHAGTQTLSFPPASCHSVTLSPPSPSFGSWPVCLVLGNTYPLHPQLPTNSHTQQHIADNRQTHSPPECLCVGGYMITLKYVCCLYRCVCLRAHVGVCVW